MNNNVLMRLILEVIFISFYFVWHVKRTNLPQKRRSKTKGVDGLHSVDLGAVVVRLADR